MHNKRKQNTKHAFPRGGYETINHLTTPHIIIENRRRKNNVQLGWNCYTERIIQMT